MPTLFQKVSLIKYFKLFEFFDEAILVKFAKSLHQIHVSNKNL
jgi:hypothetical protein